MSLSGFASRRHRARLCTTLSLTLIFLATFSGCRGNKPPSPNDLPSRMPLSTTASQPSDAPQVVPVFTDTTVAAGLDFKQSHGGCGLHYFVEQVAAGAAILDANGDGNLDLYFPQPKPLGACQGKVKGTFQQRLYLGDGKGHFHLAPNAFGGVETDYGLAAAVGDFDNDGHPDLYVCW